MTKKAFITIHSTGETAPRKVAITEETISIGRSSANMIKISDSAASRKHCIIARLGTNYRLIDLGSKNRTKVNDTVIKEKELVFGDKIQIGKIELIFTLEEVNDTDPSAVNLSEKPPEVTPTAPEQPPDTPAESTPQEQPPGSVPAERGEPPAPKEAKVRKEQAATFWNVIITVFRSVVIMVFILVLLTALFDLAIKQEWIKVRSDVNLLTVWHWGFYGIFAAIGLQFIWITICVLFFKGRWRKYQTRYCPPRQIRHTPKFPLIRGDLNLPS